MIIGLHGKKRSGKDTIADHLLWEYGFRRVAFADKLKAVLLATDPIIVSDNGLTSRLSAAMTVYGGWEGIKSSVFGPEVRRLLQYLGTEGVRTHLGDDTWVNAVDLTGDRVVVTDVRLPNEAEFLREQGAVLWHVIRPDTQEEEDSHITEQSTLVCDATIHNTGSIADLYEAVDIIMDVYSEDVR